MGAGAGIVRNQLIQVSFCGVIDTVRRLSEETIQHIMKLSKLAKLLNSVVVMFGESNLDMCLHEGIEHGALI